MLTGEVGTGKTTLCRNLLSELPENVDVALILNANINEQELLQTICDELKIKYTQQSTQKQLLDLLNQHLLNTFAENRHTVLIIDEAQLLSRDVLEQIRLLTNLETTKSKLLQIILIGQPELNQLLSRDDLRQLSQRVTARYHLGALQRAEIEDYVNFRLSVAGCKQPLFSRQALSKMHTLTGGIPRKINVLADHALLSAYARTQTSIDSKTVKLAARDVFIGSGSDARAGLTTAALEKWWLPACLLVLLNVALWWYFAGSDEPLVDSMVVNQTAVGEPNINPVQLAATGNTLSVSDPVLSSEPESETMGTATVGSVVIAEQYLDDSINPEPIVQAEAIAVAPVTDVALAETTGEAVSIDQPSAALPADLLPLAPQETALAMLLDTSADLTGAVRSFRNLVDLWQKNLPDQLIQPACEAVEQLDLQCLAFSDWEKMLRYNRPAIIVISHRDQLHRVILQNISANQAQIMVGDTSLQLSIGELRSRWTGNGVLIWQPSEVGINVQKVGDQGSLVLKTRTYLNKVLSSANLPLLQSVDLPEFDLDMSQKVFALQTRFGIGGDGVIGNETYLLMNELTQPESIPVLSSRLR